MTSELARIAVVGSAIAVALGLAWWLRRRAARHGAPVDVAGLMTGPGVVIFTKDDCPACLATLERLAVLDLPVRQVREEDEAAELRARGVTGVPVTVVLDAGGRMRAQFMGLPRPRPLRRVARQVREGGDR